MNEEQMRLIANEAAMAVAAVLRKHNDNKSLPFALVLGEAEDESLTTVHNHHCAFCAAKNLYISSTLLADAGAPDMVTDGRTGEDITPVSGKVH